MLSPMHIAPSGNEFSSAPASGRGLLRSPLSLAAAVTWLAITAQALKFNLLAELDPRQWLGLFALVGMFGLFLWRDRHDSELGCEGNEHNSLLQGLLVVIGEVLLSEGQIGVLLILVAVQLVLLMPVRRALAWLVLFNFAIWAHWAMVSGQPFSALLWLVPLLGFQAFAGLTGHYAGNSERAREHLAQVNAELLATQRLLEESARSGERLKLSRELHDVAGHKLTALKLNLARLRRDPALAAREEIESSAQLADELLADIRGVVSALRQHDGLELESALRALARPLAGTRIEVEIEPGLRVDSVAQAETLLRCAQEAITNALRHGRASLIRLRCRREAGELLLEVSNDGEPPRRIEFGNGLTGMRERLIALGGRLEVEPGLSRGFRLCVHLPESAA